MEDEVPKSAGSAADTEDSVQPSQTAEPSEDSFSYADEESDILETQEAVAEAAHPAPARSVNAPPASVDRSLHSGIDGLVLFDLTNKPGGSICFSPHTIKTILDLKLLNIGYDRQRLSFVQIRSDLAEKIAENVTVPALELGDGTYLTESWSIAEYLERRHPEGYKLFGNSATKRLAALLNDFGKTILAPHLGPLAMPGVYAVLDEESKDYFVNVKIGQARWSKISSLSRQEKEAHVQQAVTKMGVLETMLNSEGGARAGGGLVNEYNSLSVKAKKSVWVAGGDEPSHADFVLFGWYIYTRASGPETTSQIWSAHKSIKTWVSAMLEWCGPLANDFI